MELVSNADIRRVGLRVHSRRRNVQLSTENPIGIEGETRKREYISNWISDGAAVSVTDIISEHCPEILKLNPNFDSSEMLNYK